MSTGLPGPHRYLNRVPPSPLVPVRLDAADPLVWCKLEFLNPSGSTKDRIARHILEKACRRGELQPGSTVVEASSGSTSIALALACAQMGLTFIAVMPEGVSDERSLIIRAYGGDVRFTPKDGGIRTAIAEAERLAGECHGFLPRQFANPDNAERIAKGPRTRSLTRCLPAWSMPSSAASAPVARWSDCTTACANAELTWCRC